MASIKDMGDGKYRIIVCDGFKPNGKVNRASKVIRAKSKKDAQRQAAAFEVDFKRGVAEQREKGIRFSELVKRWEESESNKLAEKTRALWFDYLYSERFILDNLGQYYLNDIKPMHIQSYLNTLREDGIRRDKKPGGYSDQTIKHHHNIIYNMFAFGMINGFTDNNPCALVKSPKIAMKEAVYFDDKAMDELFKKLDEDFRREDGTWTPLYYDSECGNWETELSDTEKETLRNYVHESHRVYVKLAYTALFRRSEMCGLEFRDIDYENNIIKLYRTSHYSEAKGVYTQENKLKNGDCYRIVVMPESLMNMLKQYQELTEKTRAIMRDKWMQCDRLFIAVNGGKVAAAGGPVNPTVISQWFNRTLKRYKLKPMPLHGLRHSGISHMINQGATSAEAADRAGNTEGVVEQRYKHIFEGTRQKAANYFEGI